MIGISIFRNETNCSIRLCSFYFRLRDILFNTTLFDRHKNELISHLKIFYILDLGFEISFATLILSQYQKIICQYYFKN